MEGPRVHPYPNPLTLPLFSSPLPSLPPPTKQVMQASTRKKVRIKWLEDDSHRRSTFKKRRKGIMKKAEELHILCAVKTCAIVYGAGDSEPEVWPDKEEAARMCRGFRQMPELDRVRMMRTHAHFLQELVGKKAQQLWQQHNDIVDVQARCCLYDGLMGADLHEVNRECLVRVHGIIRGMLRECYERCTALRARTPGCCVDAVGGASALPAGSSPEDPKYAVSAMKVSTEEAPMEALVNRFLYGEGN